MTDLKLLGVVIRARWLGFAELDARRHLLDWGIVFYQRRGPDAVESASRRLEGLLSRIDPSFVVLVLPDSRSNKEADAVRSITISLRAIASSRSTQIIPLHHSAICEAFVSHNAKSKHEIATTLAQAFPELRWKLPPKRKIWAKEDPKMAIFDALAGAVAYHNSKLGNSGWETPVHD